MAVDIATLGLEVRSDGVVVASDRLRQLAAAGGQAESAANSLSSAFSNVTRYMQAAAAALAAMSLTNYIKEATLLAARVETLGVVMRVAGNNAGYTASQMQGYADALKKTGISTQEAYSNTTKMAQATLDMSKASKLARVAQDAAVVGNINSSEAFARMIQGIRSGEVEILRNIGLQVNFEQAYKKFAETNKLNANALSESQKMQARANAVLDEGAKINGVYEASMTTAGKMMSSFARLFEELKLAIGNMFLDKFTVGVSLLTDALKWANNNVSLITDTLSGLMTGAVIFATSKLIPFAESMAMNSIHAQALRENTIRTAQAVVNNTTATVAATATQIANTTARVEGITVLYNEQRALMAVATTETEIMRIDAILIELDTQRIRLNTELVLTNDALATAQSANAAAAARLAAAQAAGGVSAAGFFAALRSGGSMLLSMVGGVYGAIAIAIGTVVYAIYKMQVGHEEYEKKVAEYASKTPYAKTQTALKEMEELYAKLQKQQHMTPEQSAQDTLRAEKQKEINAAVIDNIRLKKVQYDAENGFFGDWTETLALFGKVSKSAQAAIDIAANDKTIANGKADLEKIIDLQGKIDKLKKKQEPDKIVDPAALASAQKSLDEARRNTDASYQTYLDTLASDGAKNRISWIAWEVEQGIKTRQQGLIDTKTIEEADFKRQIAANIKLQADLKAEVDKVRAHKGGAIGELSYQKEKEAAQSKLNSAITAGIKLQNELNGLEQKLGIDTTKVNIEDVKSLTEAKIQLLTAQDRQLEATKEQIKLDMLSRKESEPQKNAILAQLDLIKLMSAGKAATKSLYDTKLAKIELDKAELDTAERFYKLSTEDAGRQRISLLEEEIRIKTSLRDMEKGTTPEADTKRLQLQKDINAVKRQQLDIEKMLYDQTAIGGMVNAIQKYGKATSDVGAQLENVFTNAFKGIEDALTTFIKTGKLSFKSLIDGLKDDLARMAAKQLTLEIVSAGSSLTGIGLSANTTALSSLTTAVIANTAALGGSSASSSTSGAGGLLGGLKSLFGGSSGGGMAAGEITGVSTVEGGFSSGSGAAAGGTSAATTGIVAAWAVAVVAGITNAIVERNMVSKNNKATDAAQRALLEQLKIIDSSINARNSVFAGNVFGQELNANNRASGLELNTTLMTIWNGMGKNYGAEIKQAVISAIQDNTYSGSAAQTEVTESSTYLNTLLENASTQYQALKAVQALEYEAITKKQAATNASLIMQGEELQGLKGSVKWTDALNTVRSAELVGLDATTIALKQFNWGLEDTAEAAAEAAAKSIALMETNRGLQEQYWVLTGKKTQEEIDLKNGKDQTAIDWENKIAAATKANDINEQAIANEKQYVLDRASLQQQIDILNGTSTQLEVDRLNQMTATVDPASKALLTIKYDLEDMATAATDAATQQEKLNAVRQKEYDLTDSLISRIDAAIVARDGVDKSTYTDHQLWLDSIAETIETETKLRDEGIANEKQYVLDRVSLQQQLDVLNGTTTQLEIDRYNQLKATADPASQALLKVKYGLEDMATAAKDAATAQEKLNNSLDRFVQAPPNTSKSDFAKSQIPRISEYTSGDSLFAKFFTNLKNGGINSGNTGQARTDWMAAAREGGSAIDDLYSTPILNYITALESEYSDWLAYAQESSKRIAEAYKSYTEGLLDRSASADRKLIEDAQLESMKVQTDILATMNTEMGKLTTTLSSLTAASKAMKDETISPRVLLADAISEINLAIVDARKGNFAKAGNLEGSLAALTGMSRGDFATELDYKRSFYTAKASLTELETLTSQGETDSKKQIEKQEQLIELTKKQQELTLKIYDDELAIFKGIAVNTVPIAEAKAQWLAVHQDSVFTQSELTIQTNWMEKQYDQLIIMTGAILKLGVAVPTSTLQNPLQDKTLPGASTPNILMGGEKLTQSGGVFTIAGQTTYSGAAADFAGNSAVGLSSPGFVSGKKTYWETSGYATYGAAIQAIMDDLKKDQTQAQSIYRGLSIANGLMGFAQGTNYVPYDMTARIHEGERIIPKADNYSLFKDNKELIAEVKALRADLKAQGTANNAAVIKTSKILDKWDGDGMPAVAA